MPRWLRRLLLTFASVAALVIVVGGAALLLLQTATAKRLLAEWLETELAAATGFGVELGTIDGPLPFSAAISDIRLSDGRGPWLTADRLELDWRPAALLAGRVHVRRLVARNVGMNHAPELSDQPEEDEPGVDLAIALPDLPLPITVDDVRIERLALAADVLGTAAVLQAAGQAALGDGVRDAAVTLGVTRLDGVAGRADLQLAQSGSPAVLTLAAEVDEPAGGLIARALSLPDLPPVSLRLAGDGPAADWRGTLEAAAGPARIDATVALTLAQMLALGIDGRMQDAGSLMPRLTAFVPPSVDVAADLRWQPGRRLDIDRLSLAVRDATAELSGGLDFADDRIEASLDLAVVDAARWQALAAPAAFRSGRLRGTIAGTLDEPAFELQTTIDGLAAPDIAAERIVTNVLGRATLRDGHVVTAMSVTAEGRATGTVVGIDPPPAALLGDTVDWSVRAGIDLLTDEITVEQARVAANGSTLDAAGTIGGYGRAIDATVRADLANIAPVAELIDVAATGRAQLTAKLSGDALAPQVTAEIGGQLVHLGIADPTAAALLGAAPAFSGTIAATARDIDIGTLTIDGAGASVTAGGRMALDARTLRLNVAATVADIAPVTASLGVAARGRLAGRIQLTRTPEDPRLSFVGTMESEGLVVDEATSALLGPSVRASAEGSFGDAGVMLDAARIEGSAALLTANGRVGDTLALDYRLELPRLAALSTLAGIELDGGLAVVGDVKGPAASPALTGALTGDALRLADIAVASAEGHVNARDLGGRPQGDIALDLVAQAQRLSLATSYRLQEEGAVALDGLRIAVPQTSLTGDLVLLPGGLADGRLGGEIGDLQPISSLFGESIAGAGTIDLAFAPRDQGQAIGAELDLRSLSIDMAEGPSLSAEQVSLTADLRDAFGSPAGRGELRIDDAVRGALRLAQATVTVAGDVSAMTVGLRATGAHGRPLALDAAGNVELDGATQRLRLDRLDGSFGAINARLNAPAILSRDADGMAIAGLDATVGEGRLTGAGRLGPRQVDLRLSLADLPLDLVAAFTPQADLGGTASADLHVAGEVAAPTAHADIRLADLRVGGTGIGETVGVNGTMTVDVRDGRGSVTARLGGPPDFALDGQATVPLAFRLSPFAFELADTAPITGTIDGRIDLALVPRIVDLQGDTLGGRLAIDMTVAGTLAAPRVEGEIRIADGSYASAAAGTVLREVSAVATADNDRIVLRSLTARDAGDGRLSATGSAALGIAEDARYDGDITLTQFAVPDGTGAARLASGRIAGNVQFTGLDAEGRRRFAATADAHDLAIDGRNAGLFGPHMQAGLEGALGDTDLVVDTARIEGAEGRFAAEGRVGTAIDLDYRLELSRLASVSSLAGIDLAGSADVTGKVTGPTNSPDLSAALSGRALRVAGVVLDSAGGDVIARDLGGRPHGEVDLAAMVQGRRLSLATPYRLREDGAIALTGLRLAAPQTSLTGDLAVLPAGLLEGRLHGESGDLAFLGPFIGQSVGGGATLDLSFRPARGAQAVKADVGIRDLSLTAAGDAPLTVERLTLQADLDDVLGTPSGQAELRLENAARGALSLSRAALRGEGDSGTMQLRIDAAGEQGAPFEIDAAGVLALAPGEQRLQLDRFDGRYGSIDARLNTPATLSRDAQRLSLAGLDASIGQGRVTGSGNLDRREVVLQLALADLPLDVVTAFAPQIVIDGTASADLRVVGPPRAPTAHGEVRVTGLHSSGAKGGGGAALDGTAILDIRDGRGAMTARLGGPSGVALDGNLTVPVAFRAQPFALDVAPDASLSGAVAGTVDLALVPRIVDLHGDAVGGRLDLDMTIGGSHAAPRFLGTAGIVDGSYVSAEAGTVLRNIEASLSGDNTRIRLQSLTATDGARGRLSAQGEAVLGAAGSARYDGALDLEGFTLVNRSDAVATATGRLQLETADSGARLGGEVTIDSAELRIPEGLPPDIVKIDVIEVNVPPGRAAARAAPPEASVAPPVALAVRVRIPGRAFLRGRGVESEWRGDLRVAGTMAAPDVTGRLEVVRGDLDLLGTSFEVESGTVNFIGGAKIDPELDFTANAEANDVDARVHVTGFASAPKFEIGSASGLPPEEAMSRLLFGQSAGSLTPAQAVQLAQAAAALSGGGPGVLEKLRSSVGLDVLSLESTGPEAADTSVKAGKYISDRVFLKVEQGVTAESREVGVEVRVLPQVTVEGGVGHEGSGRVGINWRYDY